MSGDQLGQQVLPCYFMRGGSSRGGFFLAEDLPSDPLDRAAWLLAAYGSPDARQIDGIGGAVGHQTIEALEDVTEEQRRA